MKALLIHVGIDQSKKYAMTLGVNAPIFDDGTFEYIPILEFWYENTYFLRRKGRTIKVHDGKEEEDKAYTREIRTYSTMATRNKRFGKRLSDYIPEKYEHAIIHLDPDFEHFTYGDSVDTSKGSQISKLDEGDFIFFVASLAPYKREAYAGRYENLIRHYQRRNMAKFAIGYFKVQAAYEAVKTSDDSTPLLYAPSSDDSVHESLDEATLDRIRSNAHTKRDDDHYHLIVGDPSAAELLTRAVKVTENGSPFSPSKIGKKVFGNVCYPRGVKWINEESRIWTLLDYCRSCL